MRKLVFGAIFALVALSVVFSLVGVLSIWSPAELFAPATP